MSAQVSVWHRATNPAGRLFGARRSARWEPSAGLVLTGGRARRCGAARMVQGESPVALWIGAVGTDGHRGAEAAATAGVPASGLPGKSVRLRGAVREGHRGESAGAPRNRRQATILMPAVAAQRRGQRVPVMDQPEDRPGSSVHL